MRELFETVGLEAAWQVTDLNTGHSIGEQTHEALPLVSLVKVVWSLAMLRRAEHGDLDATRLVTLAPDGRAHGTTGISAMSDPVTISLRDAAYLALTISDNAAGDALLDAVGAQGAADELHALGLGGIVAGEPMRDLYDRIEGGIGDPFAPASTNTATPTDLSRLLAMIWRDEAASPASCARLRDLMQRQAWAHRLGPAFPARDITVAAKSATAAGLRHEMGVITYPGARHYVAVVMTNQLTAEPDHRADQAIGQAARNGILHLRRGRS